MELAVKRNSLLKLIEPGLCVSIAHVMGQYYDKIYCRCGGTGEKTDKEC